MRRELVIIGAGPAGLAAAISAAAQGVSVTVIDRAQHLGGQIYRGRAVAPTSSPLPERLGKALTDPRIEILLGTEVWRARMDAGTAVFDLADGRHLTASACVLATGAIERCLPFPGWDLPGVTTAGGAQAMLKGQGVVVGSRVLVAGSGPLLLPVATALANAGASVVGLLEANRICPTLGIARHPTKVREALGYAKTLVRRGIRPRAGWAVIGCTGTDRVTAAVIARVDADWHPLPGTTREIVVDAVCVSFGFVPALELPRALGCAETPAPAVRHDPAQATSVPGVFVAGESCGIGGAAMAELEGRIAGLAAARHLGVLSDDGFAALAGELRPRLAHERRFAELLAAVCPQRSGWREWLRSDTVVCRCEEITWSDVEQAIEDGADTARTVKGLSRAGMGYCQGRICGPALQQLLGPDAGDLESRHIGVPVPLTLLADTDPPDGPA